MNKKRKNKKIYFSSTTNGLNFLSKVIIVVLVLGLVINHINIAVFAKAFDKPKNSYSYDSSLTDTFEFEKQELIDEKTKNSKIYKYDNGLIETEIYNKAVHYLYLPSSFINASLISKLPDNSISRFLIRGGFFL